MSSEGRSKREHCPKCESVKMHNHVLVRPGEDVQVFVECADCGAFVARYTLGAYTCDDPYRSYLRQMRVRAMDSGSDAHKRVEGYAERLWGDYRDAKSITAEKEETVDVEDLLDDMG